MTHCLAKSLSPWLLVMGVAVLASDVSAENTGQPTGLAARGMAEYSDTAMPLTEMLRRNPAMLSEEVTEHPRSAKTLPGIEVIKERYPDGRIKIRREVTQDEQGNYIRHGSWEMWDKRGNPVASGLYRNDRRHGQWIRMYAADEAELFTQSPYKGYRGPFTSKASFRDGKLHGKWIIVDAEDRIVTEWEYSSGLRNGRCTWNYPSGNLMKETVYREGLIDGYTRTYDVNSKLIEDETYQQGRKVAMKIKYDDDGKLQWEGEYLLRQVVIASTDDWWQARPVEYIDARLQATEPEQHSATNGRKSTRESRAAARTNTDDRRGGVKHGCWTAWHPNGQTRVEGNYDQGAPHGKFIWWYPSRQKAAAGNYEKGERHGLWVWWHENGQKSVSGHYTNGQMSGLWTHWDENGRLYQRSELTTAEALVMEDGQRGGTGEAPTRAPRVIPVGPPQE